MRPMTTAPPPSLPALLAPRLAVVRPWRSDDVPDTPATAAGRMLLGAVWERLLAGEIECIDVTFRNGGVLTDIIAFRLCGAIVEAAITRGTWTHAFALDEVAMVRAVGFGRIRD